MDFLDSIQNRFENSKSSDNEKNGIIEDLIARLQSVENELESHKSKAMDHITMVRDHYLEKISEKEAELTGHQHEILSFVSLLIDADCMNFDDKLVKKGYEGGHEAVRLLKTSTLQYMRMEKPKIPSRVDVRIRVYANVAGLSKAYREAAIISNPADFMSFVQGFNMEDGLCDFVDAGTGKECADTKLKAVFEQDVTDVHCCHILFGGSGDNGYARLLSPHVDSPKITLLEGTPFERELRGIAEKLGSTVFQGIFRTSKLSPQTAPSSSTAPGRPVPDYAAAVRTGSERPETSNPTTSLANGGQSEVKLRILRNAQGQRIDPKLSVPQQVVNQIKGRKLCNEYHILGTCDYGDFCSHSHGPRKTGLELLALKQLARTRACWSGSFCENEYCIYGHCCPWPECKGQSCKFDSSLHGIDQKIVEVVVVK
ncbi:CCCH zinc finger DNA binding protein [Aspergillus clavatus NRRL 1]|uniref:CCCH zinc finger DNA binding protein n=1 Tax=Aspergillus clavatus (strain ATCC 1007 / CBS 513.65 / DSM 816 / NCTC 3887 / NRRL 1 / QM 1276 / 107) TaxID=344612 RepID=A1CCJ2_ASPCL|nr:CCCH zinc finger DNA binding protein [Aspergillus clavatus NRRL 1]EAW12249.1 CCCH zinc finger DNA binding protein [Aspergillus clavatus NRRL 1]